MVLPMRPLLLALVLAAPALARPGQPPAPSPAASPVATAASSDQLGPLLAEVDATYAHRDEAAALATHRARLAEAEKVAPNEYEVLWRLARLYVWLADDPRLS